MSVLGVRGGGGYPVVIHLMSYFDRKEKVYENVWVCSSCGEKRFWKTARRCISDRSYQELSMDCLVAKIGSDTDESEPIKISLFH